MFGGCTLWWCSGLLYYYDDRVCQQRLTRIQVYFFFLAKLTSDNIFFLNRDIKQWIYIFFFEKSTSIFIYTCIYKKILFIL